MVGSINGSNSSSNLLQVMNEPAHNAGDQNDGIIARGVGIMKRAFLHLTGQAGAAHTQQLTNLKAQVQQEMGEAGLAALNNKISASNLDSAKSTKLFSTKELNSLRDDVRTTVRGGLDGDDFAALEEQEAPQMRSSESLSDDARMELRRGFDAEDFAALNDKGD